MLPRTLPCTSCSGCGGHGVGLQAHRLRRAGPEARGRGPQALRRGVARARHLPQMARSRRRQEEPDGAAEGRAVGDGVAGGLPPLGPVGAVVGAAPPGAEKRACSRRRRGGVVCGFGVDWVY